LLYREAGAPPEALGAGAAMAAVEVLIMTFQQRVKLDTTGAMAAMEALVAGAATAAGAATP